MLAVAGANLDAVDSQGHTALLWASYKGLEIIMKILLENGADPTIADPTGRLPLHWTGRLDSPTCTKFLLEASPKWTINFQDSNERLAPVHWAIAANKIASTQVMLEYGADPAVMDIMGRTAINYAAHYGATECMKLILDIRKGAEMVRDAHGRTGLHMCCGATGSMETVSLLMSYPLTDINATDRQLMTPLHWAAEFNHPDLAVHLLEHGARLDPKNEADETPSDLAQKKGNYEVLMALDGYRNGDHANDANDDRAAMIGDKQKNVKRLLVVQAKRANSAELAPASKKKTSAGKKKSERSSACTIS